MTFSDFFGVFIVIGLYVLYEVYRWKKHEKKMENYEIEYFTPSSYTNAVIETDNPYIKCDNDHPIVYYEMGDVEKLRSLIEPMEAHIKTNNYHLKNTRFQQVLGYFESLVLFWHVEVW